MQPGEALILLDLLAAANALLRALTISSDTTVRVYGMRLLNVGDVSIRDGYVEVVGLSLMVHPEVFDRKEI